MAMASPNAAATHSNSGIGSLFALLAIGKP
jgi:hypothetical protein